MTSKLDIIGFDVEPTDKKLKNLERRSLRLAASRFEWNNPEDADGVPILARKPVSDSDPNIKVAYDNYTIIANTKASYLGSNIQRTYSDDIKEDVKDKYEDFDIDNNFFSVLPKMMATCAGSGVIYSLNYLDVNDKSRFKRIKGYQAKVIYDDDTGMPIKGFNYYKRGDESVVKEYDNINVTVWVAPKGNSEYAVESITPHGFVGIPVVEWVNNEQKSGNSEKAISLIDAYDLLMSDNITEWATFRNAYLLLKNMGLIDEKVKEELKKTGVFFGDEGAEAKFITKDVNPEFTKFITDETWSGIWIVGASVDPKAVSTLSNATAFQISQMYKLMEEDAKTTETEWKISLEYVDKLLQSYWTGLDVKAVGKYSTYDINYIFHRNIPKDVVSDLEAIKRGGGNLPQKEIFMRGLGIGEKEAQEMVEIAAGEIIDGLPDLGE